MVKIDPFRLDKDWGFEVSAENVKNYSVVHKFGKDKAVTTGFLPVCVGGVYRTPQASGATAVRIKAGGNANDTAAGTGAREITVEGLDATGALTSEALATNGISASTATTATFIRVFRAYVSKSGTYGNQGAGSHAADIVIEDSSGTEDWLTIDSDSYPRGQSQIGVYTVPLGYTAYLKSYTLTTDGNKPVDFVLMNRANILESAAPYTAVRTGLEHAGIEGHFPNSLDYAIKFEALTDVGWIAKAATSAIATVDFPLLLVANG